MSTHNKLGEKIEKLELDEMNEFEIERTVSSLSKEGMDFRKQRKDVRYKLYRLATEENGGPASGADDIFKSKFIDQPLFGGWRWFGILWDVSTDDPYRCVHRDKSRGKEWEELVANKYPRIESGGKLIYPDINVRKKIEKHHKGKK